MSKFIKRDSDEFNELNFLGYYLYNINGFIAGGCFKNIFNKEPVKDIDIFFENDEDYQHAINEYTNNDRFENVFENEKCVGFKHVKSGIQVELIKSLFGSQEEVMNRFDFTITKFSYKRTFVEIDEDGMPVFDYDIVHHNNFFQHMAQKRLVIDNESNELVFPFSTLDRMFRYAKYGYQPCRETKVKIIQAVRIEEEFSSDDISRSIYGGGFD